MHHLIFILQLTSQSSVEAVFAYLHQGNRMDKVRVGPLKVNVFSALIIEMYNVIM